jgi:hypothetical protein
MRELIFTPKAGTDIKAIYRWHEAQQPGLGTEFRTSVEALTPKFSALRNAFDAPQTAFTARYLGVFRLRFFTNLMTARSLSTWSFTPRKTLRDGAIGWV